MTLYVNAPINRMTRRMMMNGWRVAEQNSVFFPVDVVSNDEAYVFTALLPGVAAEDLDIKVEDDQLTIAGEIKIEQDENATYLLRERPSGRFSRTFRLPDLPDVEKAEASMKDGVLTLRVPKAEQARPRTIKVNVR